MISKKHISLVLFLALSYLHLNAQFGRFRHITVEDGLTQNYVSCFAQDKKGFIWIGTNDGLNMYDGVKITNFKASLTDTNTIPHNNIRFLYVDNEDHLWGATGGGGMFNIDLKTRRIKKYMADSSNANSISSNNVNYITEYEPGKLYISTLDGLNVFDKKTETFTVYKKEGKNVVNFLHNNLRYTTVDKEGHFWFGHPNVGITEYDPKTKQCTYYTDQTPLKLKGNTVRALFADSKGLIWVSTWAYGATVIDKKNNRTYSAENTDTHKMKNINQVSLVSQFYEDSEGNILFATAEHGIGKMEKGTYNVTFFENNKDDGETINDNTTFSIFQDRSGLIWCGTWKGGANIFDPRVMNFGYFKHESTKATSISNNSIFSFCPKSDNEVYIGTNMGACVFNYDTKTFTQLPTEEKDGLRHNSIIIHIYKHDDGSIWLSSFGAGLYRYYPEKNKYVNYSTTSDTNSLSFHTPVVVLKDKKERLWVGTERGLNLYNADKDNFTRIKYVKGAPGSLSGDVITSMLMQDDGKFWIGAVGAGLNLFDPETQKAKHFFNDKEGSLAKDVGVIALFIDSKGILWAGTTDGLYAINRKTEEITSFADLNPLFSSMVTNILQDDAGNIWFTNSNGLCCFDPQTKKYVLYNSANGLQGKQFSFEASCKHLNGKLFFGGLNGFNVFDPKQISLNTTPPQVVLTNFTTLNKPYYLGTDPSYTEEITLSFKDYFFEFDFAALDYTNPAKNTYAYQLEGFNENWVNIGTEKSATFTNLDPGTYTMLIKAANNDGFWGEPLKIKLTITPPFWRTVWFYLLCVVAAGLLIYGYIKRREHKLREEKAILENKVKERTAELEIEKQKVEEAHKDMKDSINYAKRIQQAQMPTDKYIEKKFKDLRK